MLFNDSWTLDSKLFLIQTYVGYKSITLIIDLNRFMSYIVSD